MPALAPPVVFDTARRFSWLRLWRSENVGPRTFETLLRTYGSAEAALDAFPDLANRTKSGRSLRIADVDDITREFEAAEKLGVRFVCRDEIGFPALLRQIADPPAVIAVRGRREILDRPAIAIVGSRNASAAGLAFTERLARGMSQAGYIVVSGFARGIDSRAHRASMITGTVAILAGGHDRLYPAEQAPFLEQILEEGAALSEMPFGWEARGRDFPRRNRLVSGLSLGVIVVEAARRSGSLITARFAADQGREVFAVPGSPLDPRAEGTNDLLRDGATFCASVDDVLQALSDQKLHGHGGGDLFSDPGRHDEETFWDELSFSEKGADTHEITNSLIETPAEKNLASPEISGAPLTQLIEGLGPAPVSVDELARCTGLPIRDVRTALLELELAGRIERHGGSLVSLIMT